MLPGHPSVAAMAVLVALAREPINAVTGAAALRRPIIWRTSSLVCCSAVPTYELTLRKPLGLAFEESEGGGLEVGAVLPGGNAARDGTVWPGDLLLKVEKVDVSVRSFDDAMAMLIDAPAECTLCLARECGKVAAVRFVSPTNTLVFASPGDKLMPIGLRQKIDVDYGCCEGHCGVCEMVLRSGETGEMKAVRMCTARIPKGSLMPWDVLEPGSEDAQAFYAEMEAKLRARQSQNKGS